MIDHRDDDRNDGVLAGPVDPDVALITDYLANELSPAEEAAVENRLIEDEEFFEKVWPLVRVWQLPVKFRDLVEPARPMPAPEPAKELERERPYADPPRGPGRVMEPAFRYVAVPEDAYVVERGSEEDEAIRDVIRVKQIVRKTFKIGRKTMQVAASVLVIAGASVFGYVTFASHPTEPVHVTRTIEAPVPPQGGDAVVETAANETKDMTLRGGSRVVVRPESKLSYHYVTSIATRAVMARLDAGEVAVEVTKEDFTMRIATPAGSVMLFPGSYALRCTADGSVLLLTVGAGLGSIRPDSTKPGFSFKTGEFGQVLKGGEPLKVPGGGKDWPKLAPAKDQH